MEVLFLFRAPKTSILLHIVISLVPSPCSILLPPRHPSPLPGGDEDEEDRRHQMGEAGGRRTRIQHQTLQSESVHSFFILLSLPTILLSQLSCLLLLLSPSSSSYFSPSAKINTSLCVCLFWTKMRMGSRAVLESFISLTAKACTKGRGITAKCDSVFEPTYSITKRINYLCKYVCRPGVGRSKS